jgi:hypothetical protein
MTRRAVAGDRPDYHHTACTGQLSGQHLMANDALGQVAT